MLEIVVGTVVVMSVYKMWDYYKERTLILKYSRMLEELKEKQKTTN